MRIEQLHYIVEVDKTHSLTKAAENLYVTQPSLTIAINTLEAELGVQLFVRSKYGTVTTDEGNRVVRLAKEILERVEEIRDANYCQENHIDILTIPAINSGILSEAVSRVWKEAKGVHISITEGKVSDIISQFLEHNYFKSRCFCLCSMSDEVVNFFKRKFHDKKISYQALGNDRMVCIAHYLDPVSKQRTVTKEAVSQRPYLEYQYYNGEGDREDILSKIEFDDAYRSFAQSGSRLRVSTLETLRQMIVQGVGVTVMPSIIENKDEHFHKGTIRLMSFADLEMKMTYYALYNEQIPLNDQEKMFLTQLKKSVREWEQKIRCYFG